MTVDSLASRPGVCATVSHRVTDALWNGMIGHVDESYPSVILASSAMKI